MSSAEERGTVMSWYLVIAVHFGDADGGGVLEGAHILPDARAAAGHISSST